MYGSKLWLIKEVWCTYRCQRIEKKWSSSIYNTECSVYNPFQLKTKLNFLQSENEAEIESANVIQYARRTYLRKKALQTRFPPLPTRFLRSRT